MTQRTLMTCSLRSLLSTAALSAALLGVASPALAQDVAGAASAFAHGQKADVSGDYNSAAEMYELANSLAPSPEALRSALRARRAAGQLGLAAIHAETLIKLYPDDKKSREVAEATITEAKQKLVRYAVHCQPRACNVVVDGAAATAEAREDHILYMEAGEHEVSASFGSTQAAAQKVSGEAGQDASLTFEAPPEPKRRPGAFTSSSQGQVGVDTGATVDSGGLPPAIFITGAVITAALTGVTIWSGLDTLKAKDDYTPNRVDEADLERGQREYDDGRDKQLRTNVLIGVTAGAAVATGVFALFTDWDGEPEQAARAPRLQVAAQPTFGGGAMSLKGSF